MPHKQPPTIDPQAAQRWQTMPVSASPWLHEEVARRMQERLDEIKAQPTRWLHWEPLRGGLQSHALLLQRYPKALVSALETTSAQAQSARQALALPWWKPQRWRQPSTQVLTGEAQQGAGSADLLWANMALHMNADPQALMAQWHKALAVDGFLMFSCLGPDTLKELRDLYRSMNWPMPNHEFTDMHDWGDMLAAAGFAEPVMDMERITLSFETPERLLQELRGLGRNLHVARFPGLRGRRWHQKLLQALAQMPLQLTFEVIYGHAFKPVPKFGVQAQSSVSLEQMRAALAKSRRPSGRQGCSL